MPRYFYDVDDRGRRVEDHVGIDQVDAAHALLDAAFILQLLATDRQNEGGVGIISVQIRDATGRCLYEAVAAIDDDESRWR